MAKTADQLVGTTSSRLGAPPILRALPLVSGATDVSHRSGACWFKVGEDLARAGAGPLKLILAGGPAPLNSLKRHPVFHGNASRKTGRKTIRGRSRTPLKLYTHYAR